MSNIYPVKPKPAGKLGNYAIQSSVLRSALLMSVSMGAFTVSARYMFEEQDRAIQEARVATGNYIIDEASDLPRA